MKWPKLNFRVLLAVVVFLLTGAAVLAGTIPNTLNYQGTLTDSTGKPVTATAKPVTFKLYTTALGGTAFWTESQTVTVTNGQFSVVLGSTIPLTVDKFTGDTYVGVTVDTGPEMLPRQKMTSVAYALKAADAIPKGVIVMWNGAADQIPEGWALCDGIERTLLDGNKITPPDLRDRFIVGAGTGSVYAINATGGEAKHTLKIEELPQHSHPVDPPRTLTEIDGSHNHVFKDRPFLFTEENPGNDRFYGKGFVNSMVEHYTEPGGAHQHWIDIPSFISGTSGSGQPHENRPPYYALAFIIKL